MVAYSFKRRFVTPIKLGLLTSGSIAIEPDEDPLMKPKRQTIRAIGKRRHARPGEIVQLYHGMRTKQCFLIGVARCTEVIPITIKVGRYNMQVMFDWKCYVMTGCDHIVPSYLETFAQADGFAGAADMLAFWQAEHGRKRFDGVLIRWAPIGQQLEAADD